MNMPLQYPTDSKGRTATFEYPLQPNINIVSQSDFESGYNQ